MFHALIDYFKRSPRAGDGKEPTMSQPIERPGTATPTEATESRGPSRPSAPGAAPDVSQQIAALTEAVNQLVRSQKPHALSQEQPAPATASEAPGGPVAAQARERYVRDHLADLPEAYRRQMPEASDERQLAEAEQSIRRQFREDLRATLGGAGAGTDTGTGGAFDMGGAIAGGRGAAAAGADYARLSPVQQIALGLRDARPVGLAQPEILRAGGGASRTSRELAPSPDAAPAGAD